MPDFTFSHVCRPWRALALDTPSLWTTIDFCRDGPDRALEQLRRSRDGPLVVTYAGDKRRTREAMDAHVNAYLSRLPSIRALTFDCIDIRDVDRLSWHKDPAPALESLSISLSAVWKSEYPPFRTHLDAWDNLFGGRAPCLRKLLLEDCCINHAWHPYTHLRALTLISRLATGAGLSHILSVLSATPVLERLYSYNMIDGGKLDLHDSSPVKPLELKHLRQWTITEDVPSLLALLPCLRLPSLTTLAVMGESRHSSSAQQLLKGLATEFSRIQERFSASLMSLNFDDDEPRAYILARNGSPKPWLSIGTQAKLLDLYIPAGFCLPFNNVTRFEMPGNVELGFSSGAVSAITCYSVLMFLPALEVLRSRGLHALELCETLLKHPNLCLRLRNLSFVPVQLPRGSADDGPTLLSRIVEVISSHRVKGSPLARFGLHEMLPEAAVALRRALNAREIHAELQSDDERSGMQLWVDAEHACLIDVWPDLLTYV
jgi:hypothetical protein